MALQRKPSDRRRLGMTLVELAAAVLVLGVAVFLLTGMARTTRQRAKRQLAVRQICTMTEALRLYSEHFRQPPPGLRNGASGAAIDALLSHPPSADVLRQLPDNLTREEGVRIVDPWGTPLRYVTARHISPKMRTRVEANDGRPIFDSAGPDLVFGPTEGRPDGSDIWGEECLLQADVSGP